MESTVPSSSSEPIPTSAPPPPPPPSTASLESALSKRVEAFNLKNGMYTLCGFVVGVRFQLRQIQ